MKRLLLTLGVLFFSCVLRAQETTVLTVYFETNSSVVNPVDAASIKNFLALPDSFNAVSLTLTGSCDDVGSEEANALLSEQRIASVKRLVNGVFKDALPIKEVNRGQVLMVDVITDTLAYRAGNRKVVLAFELKKKELKASDSVLKNARLIVGERIALNNILFEGGSSEFLPESNGSLIELFDLMQSNPTLKVCIRGHVCCGPLDRDGIDLSTGKYGLSVFRAQAVVNYLLSKGIPKDRLTFKGLGGSEPTGKGDRFDRRVEIEITAMEK